MAADYGNAIGASVQGTTGFLTLLEGKLDKRKAKKREQALGERPTYYIPEPQFNNQYLAESNAQQGLSDEALGIYENQIDQNINSSLDALLKSGGGVNSISGLLASNNMSAEQLALADDQARFRKQQILMNQNQAMSDELDKSWQLNTFDPWKDEKQAIAEAKALAENKVLAGRAMVGQSGATMAGSAGGGDFSNYKQNTNNNRNATQGNTLPTGDSNPYSDQSDGNTIGTGGSMGYSGSDGNVMGTGSTPYMGMYSNQNQNGQYNGGQLQGNYILDNLYSGNKWNGGGY